MYLPINNYDVRAFYATPRKKLIEKRTAEIFLDLYNEQMKTSFDQAFRTSRFNLQRPYFKRKT